MDVSGQPRNSGNQRIGELATLPVFLDLKGKPVLVAGESDGAAWKAELLASCGAEVHLFARLEQASDAIRAFAARADVVHHDCDWQEAHFKHFALAVGDCAPGEGETFHARARQAGVPVNVIDQPEFCQFKFGSIVNRSPLVIGISTDGAAPILAQTVRRKIEALLPHGLKHWAEVAQMMRRRVNGLLDAGSARRRFWERFAGLAFDGSADPIEAEKLLMAIGQARSPKAAGRITVVGAGPGDAELLTLKAIRALQAADVILFDNHIPMDVLELARREARRVAVGGSSPSDCRCGDAFAMALDLVNTGKRVVRLVPGDPMASPSASEEIANYRREAVSIDVIRGVSASEGFDLPAASRMRAGSVRFVAGHHHRAAAPVPSAPA
jgi:uroporphyrin-III C-methyltransferase / precorrin-2 dehydrogenase / sirohydrochlorin ferrochelatase